MDPFKEKVGKAKAGGKWWKPNEGDLIIGIYKEKREVEYKGKAHPAIDIEDEDSKELVTLNYYAVVQRYFKEHDVKCGERVGIKYLEDRGDYKLFAVYVDRGKDNEGD